MGYTTDFFGSVAVVPPLNAEEIAFLKKFAGTRRMKCEQGPYYVDRGGVAGQGEMGHGDPSVIDYNRPPEGQPGLWCQWVPSDDGESIAWDEGEKFYDSPEWMKYLIDHFLKPGALAKPSLPFLQANHTVNGTIEAEGEDSNDRWALIVKDNDVFTADAEAVKYSNPQPV